MDQKTPDHLRSAAPSLAAAVRRARIEEAERSDALAELRGAEIARLEMLYDAIRPVLDQVPEHIDLFDAGVLPGDHPRLFVDMIGFVEIGRDRRTYRFLQDTRHGRVVIAENDRLDAMAEAVSSYIARRLVEREKALAADTTVEDAAIRWLGEAKESETEKASLQPRAANGIVPANPVSGQPRRTTVPARRLIGVGHSLAALFHHAIAALGVAAFIALLVAGGLVAYHMLRAWLAAHYGLPPE